MITFDNIPMKSQKIKDDNIRRMVCYLLVLEVQLKDALCRRISAYEQGALSGSSGARLEYTRVWALMEE